MTTPAPVCPANAVEMAQAKLRAMLPPAAAAAIFTSAAATTATTATVFLVALSLMRRTVGLLFPRISLLPFVFTPEYALVLSPFWASMYNWYLVSWGLDLNAGANAISYGGLIVLWASMLLNIIQMMTFSATLSMMIMSALKTPLGTKHIPQNPLLRNVILPHLPYISMAFGVLETLIFGLALTLGLGVSALIRLAGFVGVFRGLTGFVSVWVGVGAAGLLMQDWTASIGRDGRQKIQVNKTD